MKLTKYYLVERNSVCGKHWIEVERFLDEVEAKEEVKLFCKSNPGEVAAIKIIYVYE